MTSEPQMGAPAAGEAPAYPRVEQGTAAAPQNPHFVLGVVGFVLSFIGVLNIVGLVLCIVALVKSKMAGFSNGLALAGIIIASLGILFFVAIAAFAAPMLIDAAQTCARLGDGVHEVGGATYTCTPTSFRVVHHS